MIVWEFIQRFLQYEISEAEDACDERVPNGSTL
jgi:hypothetical protein